MTVHMLTPGTTARYRGGGFFAMQRMVPVMNAKTPAQLVTYRERDGATPFLDDVLETATPKDIFIVVWGPHIVELLDRLRGRRGVYWAHSLGENISLAPDVPILCVSRFTMGNWGEDSPSSPIYYFPNVFSERLVNEGRDRDIDILVVKRKMSPYVLEELLPILRTEFRTYVIDTFVDDLVEYYNRSKVFLYDSRENWIETGRSEGFGLPPLEAMACGTRVFTSLNAGLSDYADPGIICEKIGVYSLEYDLSRIRQAVAQPPLDATSIVLPFRRQAIQQRWSLLLDQLDQFFDLIEGREGDPPYRIVRSVSDRAYNRKNERLSLGNQLFSLAGRVGRRIRGAVSSA